MAKNPSLGDALMNEPSWESTTWREKCPWRENGGGLVEGWVKNGVFACESCEPEIVLISCILMKFDEGIYVEETWPYPLVQRIATFFKASFL